jgi:hypothetical protein
MRRQLLMRIIPVTPIWRRYKELRKLSQQERLAEARRLVEHPEEIAIEFAESVAHFASYDNRDHPFYPPRVERAFANKIGRTNDVVLRLEKQERLVPTDGLDRRTKHDAGPTVIGIPSRQLVCDYVDRELLVQRTTSPAQWEDGDRNIGGLRLDVLLADATDRTPIVGELKLPGDMDPFFALVQALACAAHLASSHQYERMRRHLRRGMFPQQITGPRFDIWVLFVNAPSHQSGQNPKAKFMADLESAAETLAPRLLAQDATRSSLRRIAALCLKLDDASDAVTSEVRWAWGRSGE